MKPFYFLTAIFLINILAREQNIQAKTDTVFFEDFNEKTLDRSKWNVEDKAHTVNNEQQAYIDTAATIYLVHGRAAQGAKRGALVLKAIYHPGFAMNNRTYDFISGRINTSDKIMFTYGPASSRMKMSSGAGLWPAFW